ncbi:unnamed protein product [Brassica oleracea var. botrytis]|uniref:BED-type domain-containing protein n=2 Tax=Brassica TaxID=3705 RepID=A0A3P6AH50_BRAOL|nr:unnamed protein product [Brassica napus]VDC88945.1 unnamed protein product [Brassica oleracea]
MEYDFFENDLGLGCQLVKITLTMSITMINLEKGMNQWELKLREDDPSIANCRYCGQDIGCDSKKSGTGAMKNHIARCKLYELFKSSGNQTMLGGDSTSVVTAVKYDASMFRRSVNEMIVLNELPFAFVESKDFKRFCHNVLPIYMVVTAHWIEKNWDMQKRIIRFKPVTYHKGEPIAEHLSQCLEDWGIDKVFTVTVDNTKGNDKAIRLFTEACRQVGPYALVKNGVLLHMRCCAHVLNLTVRDGLGELRVLKGKVSRGSLSLDCITRWNSTYLMLCAALKFRVVFEKLLAEDMMYNDYLNEAEESGHKRVGPPTSHGWDEVQRLVKFLKLFFGCTLAFSASKTVTSTICYNEIVVIERNLVSLSNRKDGLLKIQAREMRNKFEKYWDGLINMNPLIIIASVLDLRNKMQFACICLAKLYGKDSVESTHLRSSIRTLLKDLYEEYAVKMRPQSQGDSAGNTSENVEHETGNMFDISDDDEEYEGRDFLYSEMESEVTNDEGSSKLDIYLMEIPVPRTSDSIRREFDVLLTWRRNSAKYPVLSELVKDVLAVQVSYVASESTFSTSGRILDPYRSCLTPYMIETLVCTHQWLQNNIHVEKLRLWNYQDNMRIRGNVIFFNVLSL